MSFLTSRYRQNIDFQLLQETYGVNEDVSRNEKGMAVLCFSRIQKQFEKVSYNLMPFHDKLGPYFGLMLYKWQKPWMTIVAAILMLLNIIPITIFIYLHITDISELSSALPMFGLWSAAFIFGALPLLHHEDYSTIVRELADEFDIEFSRAEESTKKRLRSVNKPIILYMILSTSVVAFHAIDPILNDRKILGFPTWYPFDISDVRVWSALYVLEFAGGMVAAPIIILVLFFVINSFGQICMHLDNLSFALRNRLEEENNKRVELAKNYLESDPHADVLLNEFLGTCIQRHDQILSRRINKMNKLLANSLLVFFVLYLIVVSAGALEFVSYDSSKTKVYYLKNGSIFLVGLLEIYLPCDSGNRIVDSQVSLIDAVLGEHSLALPESMKRTLSIIAYRTQQPIYIKAGGFRSLDMIAFSETVGLTYTIFTLLSRFRNSEQ